MGSVKVTACCRQLFLSNARALALTRKMASSGNIICCLRRNLSSSSRLRSSMPAWVIDEYGNNGVLRFTEEATAPSVNSVSEVLIQVHAASLNPLDISMRGGYGSNILKLRRDPVSLGQNGGEFPIILGRDVSGVVVDCGSGVTHFKPGDEVWAAIPPWKQGSLAELVNLTEYEVSHKPRSLSHMEAASIPYVAATALSALVNAGGLCRNNCGNKRVLIIGASGGVGTFSIQLLKAWGAHVTVTCSHNAEGLVRGLGADDVVDYTAGDMAAELGLLENSLSLANVINNITHITQLGKVDLAFLLADSLPGCHGNVAEGLEWGAKCPPIRFDVILDNVGGDTEQWALGLLKSWSGAKYVTLVTPLLLNIDSMGLLEGAVHSGLNLHQKAVTNMCNGVFYRWGYYAPDGPALDEVSQLVDAGKILPVVEATFPFSQVPQAFQKLEGGHARGKTVVTVAQEEEGTGVTKEEGEVETSDTPVQVREEVREAVPKS